MKIPRLAAGPLAISPAGLRLCLAVLTRGETFAADLARARAARADAGPRAWPASTGQVDVIPIQGPIARHADMFSEMSGATSVDAINADLDRAMASPSRSVLLAIDSPGGQWSGITDTAAKIRALAGIKPVVAHISGDGASAAYYLAAAASQVIASRGAEVGSIGVLTTLLAADDSEIEIVASQSPNKRPDPTTDAGRAQLQRQVDELAAIMVSDIAAYRGVTPDRVLEGFGGGAIFSGEEAQRRGMVDAVGTIEDAMRIAGAAGNNGGNMSEKIAAALGLAPTASEEDQITAAQALRAIYEATGATSHAAALGTVTALRQSAEALPQLRAQLVAEAQAQAARDREAMEIMNGENGRRRITPALLESYFPMQLGAGAASATITVSADGVRTVTGATAAGLENLKAYVRHAAPIPEAPKAPAHAAERVGDDPYSAEERERIEKLKAQRRAERDRTIKGMTTKQEVR